MLFQFMWLTSLGWLKPLYRKGLEQVRLEVLTSLRPHLNLTSILEVSQMLIRTNELTFTDSIDTSERAVLF